MKLRVISNTATVIPPLVFAAAPAYSYPSGGNPGSVMLITPSMISAFNSVSGGPLPVPAAAVVDIAVCPMVMVGTKKLLIYGSLGPLTAIPVGAGSRMMCTVQLLLGATIVAQQLVDTGQELTGNPIITPSFSLQGTFTPTVAGAANVTLRLINASQDIHGDCPMQPVSGVVTATEYA